LRCTISSTRYSENELPSNQSKGQSHVPSAKQFATPAPYDPNVINFYNSDAPFYEFTNFQQNYPINLDGRMWPTTEHYFQAQKFVGSPLEEHIRRLPSPRQAFDAARSNANSKRRDWETVKDSIMYKAVKAKFTQHVSLKNLLLGTQNKKLVEHTSTDKYWGDGGDGSGKNQLGKTLMFVRNELISEYQTPSENQAPQYQPPQYLPPQNSGFQNQGTPRQPPTGIYPPLN
jgi:hypothetical protein